MPHILHDIFSCSLYAASSKPQLYKTKISHCNNAGKNMAPDFAIRSVSDREGAYQVIVFA
jgi:hypothetical protein